MITSDARTFRDALPEGGRLAGLDVGTKTIGLAYCDADWTIASAAETLKRAKFAANFARLRELFAKQSIQGAIVGLPLNMDGSDSTRTQSIRAFARNLAPLDIPVLLWDERWSTDAVTRTLLAADTSRARRAELVDKMAAAYILQGAIDALAGII
jgi:putative Holliday junction resolvase